MHSRIRSLRNLGILSCIGALPALSLGCSGDGVEEAVRLSAVEEPLQFTHRVRVQVLTVEPGFVASSMTNALAIANPIWASAGIQFDFDPASDVMNPGLPNCNDATVGAFGDTIKGKIAVFYCPSRGGSASSSGPNSVAWAGDVSPILAHEFGHYFHLGHTFREGWVAEDRDIAEFPGSRSVESCIRAKLQNQALPAGCPNLATGAAIRDFLLDGDGFSDTGITLQVHPSRAGAACGSSLFVPLVVHFSNGTTQDFGFSPARNNALGYYLCSPPGPALGLSPSQVTIARNALLVGNRNHLINKSLALWNSAFSDANGWNQEKHYRTIGFPDVNSNGRADVCGRGSGGINCALSSGTAFTGTSLWNSAFSDANGWGSVQYYSTIRYPNVNGTGGADVCGRGSGGIVCATSNGSSFTGTATWNSAFSDANGWNAEKHYGTIGFPDVNSDARADVCGRGSGGINCATSSGSAFTGTALWNSAFSDANGWGTAPYYSTIKYPNVNGTGGADVCGRGVFGVTCATSNGAAFTNTATWASAFSDANGWTAIQYYSTIQFPDLNADGRADVCGRGIGGLMCGISNGSSFTNVRLWSGAFGDNSGWNQPQYYRTISFPDLDSDGRADVCGRGTDGVYCAYSDGSAFVHLQRYSTDPSDAAGWNQPQYYSTLSFAKVDSDAAPELCGRGVAGILCER